MGRRLQRTCFYDLAAKRAAASDQSWSDMPSLTARCAARRRARMRGLLASAREDARAGLGPDQGGGAAAARFF